MYEYKYDDGDWIIINPEGEMVTIANPNTEEQAKKDVDELNYKGAEDNN